MKRDYIEFQSREYPVGYLLTFRTYGTWLHGDPRGSVDRHHNRFGTPALPASEQRQNRNRALLNRAPVYLNKNQRSAVQSSMRETCDIRQWTLWDAHARTNHVHVVLSCGCKPGSALTALKANATRWMRDKGCWNSNGTPWQGGSKKYLWDEEELQNAVAYVRNRQGLPLT